MSNKEKHTFSSGSKKKDFLNLHSEHVSADRAILIHIGNTPINTEGCLLVNWKYKTDEVYREKTHKPKINNIRSFATEFLGVVLKTNKMNLPLTLIIKNEFKD